MSHTLTLTLDDESFRFLAEAAEAQNRSIDNLVQTAAMEKVREDQFADEFEMAEIRRDEDLMARLREGSADAKARRGRFVE